MASGLYPELALLVTNLYAPPGTSIPMAQASAPLGWTSTSVTDASFRYNTSTGGASGGSTNWSTWNQGGTVNCNNVTLAVGNLPSHNHTITDLGHVHSTTLCNSGNAGAFGIPLDGDGGSQVTGAGIQTATTGISINNTGSGTAFTPTITTPNVKYVDHILAVKA